MINHKVQWHPQFAIYRLAAGDAIFLAETEQFLLTAAEFIELDTLVQQAGLISDYLLTEDDLITQVRRMQKLNKLLAGKVLLKPGAEPQSRYLYPDFNLPFRVDHCAERSVYFLSRLADIPGLQHWIVNLALDEAIALVVVDDLLDPRLLRLNQQFKDTKQDWLLFKPAGQKPSIGPLFTQTSGPCYACLLTRLQLNNPVRAWHRRQNQTEVWVPVPIRFAEQALSASLENMQEFYIKRLPEDEALRQTLYTVGEPKLAGEYHYVSHRPQCAVCGNPLLIDQLFRAPLQIESCYRGQDMDGGFRVKARADTVQALKPLLSPITGILTDISEISPAAEEGLAIFRVAYFQNTYSPSSPDQDTFVQLSLGKGVTKTQAMASALGEALERQAGQYSGEEPIIYALAADLPYRAMPPAALTPFSESQYQYFSSFQQVSLEQPQWVAKYANHTPLHWLQGWSLTANTPVYFPAAYCLANTPFADQCYSLYSHNGNAAGNTLEEAVLQGVLELIERDAVAVWWYNQIPRPEIDLAIIPAESLKIIAATLDAEWHYWLLDVTHDIAVTTCVAMGRHKETGQFMLGFGCHLAPEIAAQRALTEMYQLIVIKDKVTGPFDFAQLSSQPFLHPKRKAGKKTAQDFSVVAGEDIKADIEFVRDQLKQLKLELCVVNYSRPDLPLKTLKVIVPGLCHFWPQFANRRLFEVPVRLGWLSKPLQESEMNAQALYL